MNDKITPEKIEKYFTITEKALKEVRKNIIKGKEKYSRKIKFQDVGNVYKEVI